METAHVSAMLAVFVKRACSVECFRVARLVGNIDDDVADFDRESEREFNKLLDVQGEKGMDVIVVQKLRDKDNGQDRAGGMEGIGIKELVCVLCTYIR